MLGNPLGALGIIRRPTHQHSCARPTPWPFLPLPGVVDEHHLRVKQRVQHPRSIPYPQRSPAACMQTADRRPQTADRYPTSTINHTLTINAAPLHFPRGHSATLCTCEPNLPPAHRSRSPEKNNSDCLPGGISISTMEQVHGVDVSWMTHGNPKGTLLLRPGRDGTRPRHSPWGWSQDAKVLTHGR